MVAKKKTSDKLWGGRFAEATDNLLEKFSQSVSFDWQLYDVDIAGSIAHAKMLAHVGLISQKEAGAIAAGLKEILQEIEAQGVSWFDPALEDVHMNIEQALTAKIGDPGKKLHTGRSRNDQVALDLRMKLKLVSQEFCDLLKEAQQALVQFASKYEQVIISEYTHLQHAQPVLLAHHVLAYVEMFDRDIARLQDAFVRMDVMPLGSGACVGSGLPLDREFVRKELGFSKLSQNSVDAVSDRDFVVEFMSALSLLSIHLSRFCEEWILWTSTEFGLIELSDAYCTGSSMMPQKKNADALELIRGCSGSVVGDLVALLTMLKGLPLAYNRDMQDDKRRLFETIDRLKLALMILCGLVDTATVREHACAESAGKGFSYATDMADYLVLKGMPFRETHHVVGQIVAYCQNHSCDVGDLSLETLQQFSTLFDQDIFQAITLKQCVQSKDVVGGTAPKQVKKQLRRRLT